MSFADLGSVHRLLTLMTEHRRSAYLILFLGAYFETVVPFSFFVIGEVFFFCGAMLAGMDILNLWGVLIALYCGGILGDNSSYWIGYHYGIELFEHMARWPVVGRLAHVSNYRKGVEFFRRRGAIAVFTARLSGPLSWITPAMAGVFRLSYRAFLRFNTPGVLIGISEFVIAGYLLGNHLDTFRTWLNEHGLAVGLVIVGVIALVVVTRRHVSQRAGWEWIRAWALSVLSKCSTRGIARPWRTRSASRNID